MGVDVAEEAGKDTAAGDEAGSRSKKLSIIEAVSKRDDVFYALYFSSKAVAFQVLASTN